MRNIRNLTLMVTTAVLLLTLAVPAVANNEEAAVCSLPAGEATVNPLSLDGSLNVGDEAQRNAGSCICPKDFGADPSIAQGWACESSCSAATSACQTDAFNKADAACFYGVCFYGNLTYRPASGCLFNHSMCPGKFLRDCDLEYWCDECIDEPPL